MSEFELEAHADAHPDVMMRPACDMHAHTSPPLNRQRIVSQPPRLALAGVSCPFQTIVAFTPLQ